MYSKEEIDMSAVTVSPKYQVVIPKVIRERAGISPGDTLQVLSFDDRIELVRTRPMRDMRGFLRGLDPSFVREEEDRA
jgi:AbrB family looped-hinge helix DNA binding protein